MKSRTQLGLLFFSLILALLLIPSESGAMINGFNFATFGGPGFEFNEQSQIIPIYGVSGTYVFNQHFDFGAEFAMRGPITTFGADFNYFFRGGLFFGVQMGLDFANPITYYLGPQVGYDYLIHPQWSIGPEVQYLYTIHDRGGIFELLFNVKFYLSPATPDQLAAANSFF